MNNKFRNVATDAVNIYCSQKSKDFKTAWVDACTKYAASKNLGCPWATFITLCTNGFITGIEKGDYQEYKRLGANKEHTLFIMKVLDLEEINRSYSKTIWDNLRMPVKTHNGQIDVIAGLYINQKLNLKAINDFKLRGL